MATTLNDFSVPALVRAIKTNWADYYTFLGRSSKAELTVGPYLTWLLSGIPDPFLNVVFRTQLPSDRVGEIVDEALAHFRSRGIMRLTWWAEAEAGNPSNELDRHLRSRGLVFNEGGTGMAADLMALHNNLPALAGLRIVPVEDKATLQQWIHVARIGFGVPAHGESRWFELYADLAFETPMRCFLALLNGQPVGSSQYFLSAGVAGIYQVTCLPEARKQGIGAAITLAPLLEARQMGYRIGILQASHLGSPVYRRLGFQDYGRLNTYSWVNELMLNAPQGIGEGSR